MNIKIKEELIYFKMFLGTVAIFLIVMVGPAIIGHIETHYTREDCVVVNIVDDEVIVKDKGDRLWSFYITEDSELEINDIIDVKMFTNYTDDNIDDDEIVDIKIHKKG
jgi:hypothetical protein